MKREAEERAEKTKQQIEQVASDLEDRAILDGVKNRNFMYEVLAFLVLFVVTHQIVRDKRYSTENALKPYEKAGVFIGVVGVAVMVFSLFMSSPWIPQVDLWGHLMRDIIVLEFWPYLRTRYIVLFCIGLMLYGGLVYLDIVRVPRFLLSRFESS